MKRIVLTLTCALAVGVAWSAVVQELSSGVTYWTSGITFYEGSYEPSQVEATFSGRGVLSFEWRVAEQCDYGPAITMYADGYSPFSKEWSTGWVRRALYFSTTGSHYATWYYNCYDYSECCGGGSGMIRNVKWVSNATLSDADLFRYSENNDGTVTITGINGIISGTLNIPATLAGKSVSAVNGSAFSGCSLTSLSVASGNACLSSVDGVLYNKTQTEIFWCPRSKTAVSIPATVTNICDSAFDGCSSLSAVTLPSGLQRIGNRAFRNCFNLQIDSFPDSVDSVGSDSFHGCSKLTVALLAPGVEYIDDDYYSGTYAGCYNVKKVQVHGHPEYSACSCLSSPSQVTEIIFRSDVTEVSAWAFSDLNNLSKVTFKGNKPIFKAGGDGGMPSACSVFVSCTSSGWDVTIPGTWYGHGIFYDGMVIVSFDLGQYGTRTGGGELRQVIAEGSSAIVPTFSVNASWKFTGWSTSYENVTKDCCCTAQYVRRAATIGGITWQYTLNGSGARLDGATTTSFALTSLPSQIDGYNVLSIGPAFPGAGITSVNLNDSRVSGITSLFAGCTKLASVTLGGNVTNIGNSAFSGCTALTSVSLATGVTSVGAYAFEGCSALATINWPSTITSVGEGAFRGCSSVSALYLTDVAAFCNATYATEYRSQEDDDYYDSTPLSCTSKSASLYLNGSKVSHLVIPDGVTRLPYYSFKNTDISSITIPPSLESIGSESFSGCSVKNVYISDLTAWFNLGGSGRSTYWGGVCYSWCPLVSGGSLYVNGSLVSHIDVPEGIMYIGENKLSAKNLKSVSITASVTGMGYGAFSGSSITSIVFNGNAPIVYDDDGYSSDEFSSYLRPSATVSVRHASTGWGVSIPGIWKGFPIEYQKEEYRVDFDIGTFGVRSNGGELVQYVCYGLSATAPVIEANDGYAFVGWDKGFDDIRGNLVVTAIYRQVALAEALSATNLTFCNSGDADWYVSKDSETHKIVARSGMVGNRKTSAMQTSVSGAGTISFSLKVSSEADKDGVYDGLRFYIDSIDKTGLLGGEIEWQTLTYEISGSETHALRWEYEKDRGDYVAVGQDCAWLADVKWIPKEPIPVIDADASETEIAAALDGSVDTKLTENIKDGTTYGQYREWANNVKAKGGSSPAGADAVKNAPNAWLAFALGSETLIEAAPTDGDLKVDNFEPANESGKFDFTVSVKDIQVGSDAAADNLKKVFGLEGGTSLEPGGLSSANVNITFGTPENGKVKFTAGPKNTNEGSFFMRVKMTP